MKNKIQTLCGAVFVAASLLLSDSSVSCRAEGQMEFINIQGVTVEDPFWSPKFNLWRQTTANDILDKFEGKHLSEGNHNTFNNFDLIAQGQKGKGGHFGAPWFDGLVYETIRGIADYLAQYPDPVLETRTDAIIERIAAAQGADPNGYLNTYTDLNESNHRWGENGGFLRWQHDVYNAGALVEAGVHYYQATGKTALLTVATRLANYMCELMGPAPRKNIVPSHSGPEEALIKLYLLYRNQPQLKKQIPLPINEKAYWELVIFWLENRGHHCGFPIWEEWDQGKSEKWIRDNTYADPKFGNHSRPSWGDYAQDRIPLLEQQTIEGHAVRATLLATGLTTAALENNSPEYIQTTKRLWGNMVGKRMFITGGVGAIHHDEKFGPDYFLPSDAYLETCAAIGAAFFSQRMAELTAEGQYMDEVERVLYNSLLTAVSLSGTNYTYQNPLNSENHNRWEWHGCPCCPPMFLKITSALPGWIYSIHERNIWINLFISSRTTLDLPDKNKVALQMQTTYPWDGNIQLELNPEKKSRFCLRIRIPGWARGIENPDGLYISDLTDPITLKINDKPVKYQVEQGYALIERHWDKGDTVTLELPMLPRLIKAHPEVENLRGQAALASGPVIYCFESIDNPKLSELKLSSENNRQLLSQPNLLGGINVIRCQTPIPATAIPYYSISNRSKNNKHKVWLPLTD